MINLTDVTFAYPAQNRCVCHDFSLALEPGKIYGLLGKNGAGKSTLLYLMSGLLRAQSGTVEVDGMDVHQRSVEMLREMFIVPEEFDLPDTTLREYIDTTSRFYPHFSHEVIERCLADFDMPADLHLRQLSMGQKKKVYVSFALAARTRWLLLDEPTNGLDIPSKSQFRKVVADNADEHHTIIVSTHQVHDIEPLVNHVLLFDGGRMALNASVDDICRRYVFASRPVDAPVDDAIYSQPTSGGHDVIALRHEGMEATPINLELLFNAVVSGAELMCGENSTLTKP